MMTNPKNGPLAGIKVLDLSAMIAGPFAGAILADQGAEVIKVEPVGVGDLIRYMGPSRNGVAALFHNANRGKRSLALDLKKAEALEIVYTLVESHDVVIQNYRPGVVGKLKIDYDTLSAINPEIVYLSISGYGKCGPLADKPAYDNVIQAFSGIAQLQASGGTGDPCINRQLIVDKLTAVTGCQAITAALLSRERGLGGQHVELSMVDAVSHFLWLDAAGVATFDGSEGVDLGINLSKNVKLFPFADGYVAMSPVTDKQFEGTCRAVGIIDIDPRLLTMAGRNQNSALVAEFLELACRHTSVMPVDEGIRRLEEEDVPCSKVMSLDELPNHPQMIANDSFVRTDHPVAGKLVEANSPARFSSTPSGVGGSSAALGQHSDEILNGLGLDEAAIEKLRESGAVG